MPTSTLLHFLSLFVNRIHRVHVFISEMLWHATHHCCCHACLLFLCWNVHFRCATELRSCSFVSANVDCFFFFSLDSQIHAFPLCDIPLWGGRERGREREPHHEWTSMLFKQHKWGSYQNVVVPKALSCPHIPHCCLTCRLLIKLICWFRDTQEGWESRFLCPAIGLSWRGPQREPHHLH